MHINDALDIMIPSKAIPVNLEVWTSDGSVMKMRNVVAIKADFRNGTHTMKFLDNPTVIRKIRDYCIYKFNDEEIYI